MNNGNEKTSEHKIAKSLLAGMLIGIGGCAYLSAKSAEVGAVLFSVGLISVIVLGCNLYTGKVGYLKKASDALPLLQMIIGNVVGAAIVGILASFCGGMHERAMEIVSNKLTVSFYEVFIRAVFCGVMIYLAVETHKKYHHILTIVFPVVVFILCGFEHCVADAFYFAAAWQIPDIETIAFLLICIIGNGVGSVIINRLQYTYENNA